jgi:hypothetical protein
VRAKADWAAVRFVGPLAALGAVLALGMAVRALRSPSSTSGVQVTVDAVLRSADGRGTDVLGTIHNPSRQPLAMMVRVRGYDIADRAVLERTVGPFRNVRPGQPYAIQAYLDAVPLKTATFEPVDVHPADSFQEATR